MVTLRMLLLQRTRFSCRFAPNRSSPLCLRRVSRLLLQRARRASLHLRPPDLLIQSGDFVPPLRGSSGFSAHPGLTAWAT
jgi:hypothetical protein